MTNFAHYLEFRAKKRYGNQEQETEATRWHDTARTA